MEHLSREEQQRIVQEAKRYVAWNHFEQDPVQQEQQEKRSRELHEIIYENVQTYEPTSTLEMIAMNSGYYQSGTSVPLMSFTHRHWIKSYRPERTVKNEERMKRERQQELQRKQREQKERERQQREQKERERQQREQKERERQQREQREMERQQREQREMERQQRQRESLLERQISYDSEIDDSDTYSDEGDYYNSDEYYYGGGSYQAYLRDRRRLRGKEITNPNKPKQKFIIDPVLFKDMPDTLACGICMETVPKAQIVVIQCRHNFCSSCIHRQIKTSKHDCCAYCRQKISILTVENSITNAKISS
jgi:hypothetical protein